MRLGRNTASDTVPGAGSVTTTRTRNGEWKRYTWADGRRYAEYRSRTRWAGLPLLHYSHGINPETGRRVVARGVVAVGRMAVGVVAIGQASLGLVAIGQFAVGLALGLGQASSGVVCLGQLSVGALFAAGQLANGYIAIGQLAIGKYILAQTGYASYAWTPERRDPEAVEMFTGLWEQAQALF
jgi:hypothetical protein